MSFFFILVSLFFSCKSAIAEPSDETDYTIVVEAPRDFEVYVAPPNIVNDSINIADTIPRDIAFGYAASHYHNMKIDNGTGGYESFNINYKGRFLLYNQDTIGYAWEGCNYRINYKKCSFDNNHWLLETNVTITDEQVVVSMFLYDERLQLLGRSSITNTHQIKYVQRQKVTQSKENSMVSVSQQPSNCNKDDGSCNSPGGSYSGPMQTGASTVVEDLPPEKIEIPVRLLEKHFAQASIRLWTGVKVDLY